MATPTPAHSLAAHLISQTLSSLALLESLGVVNAADARSFRSKLPAAAGPFPSLTPPAQTEVSTSISTLSIAGPPRTAFGQQSPPRAPPVPSLPPRGRAAESRAKALWDYHGTVRSLSGKSFCGPVNNFA